MGWVKKEASFPESSARRGPTFFSPPAAFVRRHRGSIHGASLDKTRSEMKEGRGNLSQVKLADPGERLVH